MRAGACRIASFPEDIVMTATASARARRLLDAAHSEPRVQASAAAGGVRDGHVLHDRRRQAGARRSRDPVVRERRALPAEDRGRDTESGGDARLRVVVLARPPARLRGRAPARRARARGHRPCLLHQLRVRGGRDRAQDRARLSPSARRGDAHPVRRPRARVPRCQLRRDLGRRRAGVPQGLRGRIAAGGRSLAPHAGSRRARLRARRTGERVGRRSPTSSKAASSRSTTPPTSPP